MALPIPLNIRGIKIKYYGSFTVGGTNIVITQDKRTKTEDNSTVQKTHIRQKERELTEKSTLAVLVYYDTCQRTYEGRNEIWQGIEVTCC